MSHDPPRIGPSRRDDLSATLRWHGGEGSTSLAEGAKVEYEVEEGPKGPQARSVSVVASV